jgi:hypothetical protein
MGNLLTNRALVSERIEKLLKEMLKPEPSERIDI